MNSKREDALQDSPHPQPTRKRGDGGIFLRGRTYWIRYSYRGEPQRESSHSTNPEVAEKLLKRRMKEVWADRTGLQTFIPRADRVLVNDLLDGLVTDYELDHGHPISIKSNPISLEADS